MKFLLDTHILIWFLNGEQQLSENTKTVIENPANDNIISIASIWEIAIKISLGKFKFEKGFTHFLKMIEDNGFDILPITFEHALELSTLSFIHRDPFDRLLIAQCIADKLVIVTKDPIVEQYSVSTIW